MGVIINKLISEGRFSLSDAGSIISARSLGYLSGAFLSGKLFKTIEYVKILPFYFFTIGFIMIGLLLSNSLLIFVVVYFLFGIVKNLITVGGNQLATTSYKYNIYPNMINNIEFLYCIGNVFSPAIIGIIILNMGLPGVVILFVFLSIFNVILYFHKSEKISINDMDYIMEKNQKSHSATLILVVLFFAFYAGFEIFVNMFSPYVINLKTGNEYMSYLSNSLFWLFFSFTKIIFMPIIKHFFNERSTVVYCLCGTIITFSVFMFSQNLIILVIFISLLGMCMGNILPYALMYLSISNRISEDETSWCFLGLGIGGIMLTKGYSYFLEKGIYYVFIFAISQVVLLILLFCLISYCKIFGNHKFSPP